jgi:arylsulfatase
MYGVKWRNFKLVLVAQKYSTDAPARLATPRIINLTVDPQEREAVSVPYLHSWTVAHFNRLLGEFHKSTEREPLIPMGAPLGHSPMPADAEGGR